MLYAIKDNQKIIAEPSMSAICPECGQTVISKCGEINVWHWAHVVKSNCDIWGENETPWHLSWKNEFPLDWREAVISKSGITHRADVLTKSGWVLEFQHSSLTPDDVRKREHFYRQMIWIIDITETPPERFYYWERAYGRIGFRWKHPLKFVLSTRNPVYLDIGNNDLFCISKFDYAEPPYRGNGKLYNKQNFINFYNSLQPR